ncbi:MAG: hypothetical protein KBD01_13135 [Acidobacteria bacterium]|nr:hypothetical protein [Acidobacteriota bacterium]
MRGSAHPARLVPAVLVGAALLAGLATLGTRDLWPPDEPKYALAAREMAETGQWWIPHVNGEPYPDKPPLLFWAIAAAGAALGGIGQPAAVLPSLLAAALALAGTAALARRLAPAGADWVPASAVALTAISHRFAQQAIAGQTDMLLAAGTTWAFTLLLPPRGERAAVPSRAGTVAGFAAMGLATLAKGPPGLLLPLGGLALGGALASGWRTWARTGARRLHDARGWIAYAAVVGAWLVPAAVVALRGGEGAWLQDLLFRQTAVRYVAAWHHHQPPWYFLLVPWYDFLPSVALLPAALAGLRRRDDSRAQRLLLAGACLFILAFFSLSPGKRGLYLLPAYPLAAVWLALELDARLRGGGRSLRAVRGAAAALALLAAGFAVLSMTAVAAWFAKQGLNLDPRLLAGALLASAVLFGIAAAAAKPARWLAAGAAGWAAAYLAGLLTVVPALDPRNSAGAFVAEARAHLAAGAPAGMVDFRAQFGFHAGRMQTADPSDEQSLARLARRLEGAEPFWVIVRERHLAELRRHLSGPTPPVVVLRRTAGDNVYVALANAAALAPGGRPR